MQLTGHPFIDVGLAIAVSISKKKTINELTNSDMRYAVKELLERLNVLSRLKVLKDFWQNNPLMGINPGQLPQYKKVLEGLANDTLQKKSGLCQICGSSEIIGVVNRSWFPLAGSPDSDPTTLPELVGKKICPCCFCAVVILPLGCLYSKTGPYFYHILDTSLQVEALVEARYTLNTIFTTFQNEDNRIIGNQKLKKNTQLKGRLELLEIVSGNLLWDHTQPSSLFSLSTLPSCGATIIAFSNDKSARLIQLHLPAQALEFFSYLKERGKPVYNSFLNLAKKCEGDIFEKICDDIEQRCSLAPLMRTIIRNRKQFLKITKEEKIMIHDYETIALQKKERFDTLERLAKRMNEMEDKYRNAFIKQLGNTTTMKKFLELLRQFAKPEKTGFLISAGELRTIVTDSNPSEAISLLYLLCISEQSKEN